MEMQPPAVTGRWESGDASANHLEIAATERPDVFAMRDSFDPGRQVYATEGQILKFADTVQRGQLRGLLPRSPGGT